MTQNEKRQLEYPETKFFKFYNANPKGKITDDCVIRAIAQGQNISWNEAYTKLFNNSVKLCVMPNNRKNADAVLKSDGWVRMSQPKHYDGRKVTARELIYYYSQWKSNVSIIASIGAHHFTCICDINRDNEKPREYKVHDIWDCSDNCIGVYYIKYTDDLGIIPSFRDL